MITETAVVVMVILLHPVNMYMVLTYSIPTTQSLVAELQTLIHQPTLIWVSYTLKTSSYYFIITSIG